MTNDNLTPLQVLADQLRTRLHPAANGRPCACGACRHQVLLAAHRTGAPVERLTALVLRTGEPDGTSTAPTATGPGRGRLSTPVVTAMTVTQGRDHREGTEGLVAVLRHR